MTGWADRVNIGIEEKRGGFKMDKFVYEGICCHCFEPILRGQVVQLREGGRRFHKRCVGSDSYYLRMEKRLSEKGGNKKRS